MLYCNISKIVCWYLSTLFHFRSHNSVAHPANMSCHLTDFRTVVQNPFLIGTFSDTRIHCRNLEDNRSLPSPVSGHAITTNKTYFDALYNSCNNKEIKTFRNFWAKICFCHLYDIPIHSSTHYSTLFEDFVLSVISRTLDKTRFILLVFKICTLTAGSCSVT